VPREWDCDVTRSQDAKAAVAAGTAPDDGLFLSRLATDSLKVRPEDRTFGVLAR